MTERMHDYFLLDKNYVPFACTKEKWMKGIVGNRHLFKDKANHKRIVTSFVSKHLINKKVPFFKTTVYGNTNFIIYVCYYHDYDSALKGHKLILEKKPWEA